jgi:hypothetical protein
VYLVFNWVENVQVFGEQIVQRNRRVLGHVAGAADFLVADPVRYLRVENIFEVYFIIIQ